MPLKRLFTASFFAVILLGTSTHAFSEEPFMSAKQYEDYSVRYQCILNRFHDDLEKKEEALVKLDEDFGLNEDNFDAFDELASEYERDQDLLDEVRARVAETCPGA
ncbi:MAG: hypothetical protein R3183_00445 [Oleiphilaceae bacterium]|nr:hypothetical protein [Oleiphilaceae bacterium]